MRYYTREFWNDEGMQRSAGTKAREDVNKILAQMGWKEISAAFPENDRKNQSKREKLRNHLDLYQVWRKALAKLHRGDTLLVQFPVINHTLLFYWCLREVQRRGVRIVLLIHDLELLRVLARGDVSGGERLRIHIEEETLLNICDRMIVHNRAMKRKLVSLGFDRSKMVSLGIFDYLADREDGDPAEFGRAQQEGPVVIAGTLRRHKCGYVYALPADLPVRMYGVGYEGEGTKIHEYLGSFPPEDLPEVLDGSFGLVWDGDRCDTCSGAYGEYLRINNPHKASLYIASGLPVIIWEQAALAEFVLRHHCGIAAASLEEIPAKISAMSPEEYQSMVLDTRKIARRLRGGKYTRRAVERALEDRK